MVMPGDTVWGSLSTNETSEERNQKIYTEHLLNL
jgi:hypothetical protein